MLQKKLFVVVNVENLEGKKKKKTQKKTNQNDLLSCCQLTTLTFLCSYSSIFWRLRW